MAVRSILIHPDPRLKKACEPVSDPVSVASLIGDMLETMYDAPGIGLAAPQVGVNARLLVMDCAGRDEARQPMALMNPAIVALSEAMNEHEEGCLSIPEKYAVIERPAEVTLRWTTPDGEAAEHRFDGLWATCVQHEIDHLNGKLFIDHISAV